MTHFPLGFLFSVKINPTKVFNRKASLTAIKMDITSVGFFIFASSFVACFFPDIGFFKLIKNMQNQKYATGRLYIRPFQKLLNAIEDWFS
jgi:hypothetical protein